MRKLGILAALLVLGACSRYEPVVDLKASKDPREFQESWMSCEWLTDKYDLSHEAISNCLKGRGFSIIGERKL